MTLECVLCFIRSSVLLLFAIAALSTHSTLRYTGWVTHLSRNRSVDGPNLFFREGLRVTQKRDDSTPSRGRQEMQAAQFAMRISLIFGFAMLIGKLAAYFMTHSAAIFSDAAESVIHVIAVGFASFSLTQRQAGFGTLPLRLRANRLLLRRV